MPGGLWEFDYKIDAERVPPFVWNGEWLEFASRRMSPRFHLEAEIASVTNFIWPYLHQFFDDSHGLKASLKPLRRPFDKYQSHHKAINNGRDIRQINW